MSLEHIPPGFRFLHLFILFCHDGVQVFGLINAEYLNILRVDHIVQLWLNLLLEAGLVLDFCDSCSKVVYCWYEGVRVITPIREFFGQWFTCPNSAPTLPLLRAALRCKLLALPSRSGELISFSRHSHVLKSIMKFDLLLAEGTLFEKCGFLCKGVEFLLWMSHYWSFKLMFEAGMPHDSLLWRSCFLDSLEVCGLHDILSGTRSASDSCWLRLCASRAVSFSLQVLELIKVSRDSATIEFTAVFMWPI